MFNNIGKEIKGIAKPFLIICLILAFGTLFAWLVVGGVDSTLALVGIASFLVFCIIGWVGNMLIYAFGEMVDKNCEQVRCLEILINCNQQIAEQVVPNYKKQDTSFLNNSADVYQRGWFNIMTSNPMGAPDTRKCEHCGSRIHISCNICPVCKRRQ